MKQIKELEKKKLEIEKQIECLKQKDFIEVKNFRIYKWSKPVKDFVFLKGFRLAEEKEFIALYDSGFKIENYPVVYFTKNRSKLNIKKGWSLSGLCLDRDLNLYSYYDDLADSDDDGRVVCIKITEKKE